MKYDFARQIIVFGESLPARGVWIEIWATDTTGVAAMSLPARGVWIEM